MISASPGKWSASSLIFYSALRPSDGRKAENARRYLDLLIKEMNLMSDTAIAQPIRKVRTQKAQIVTTHLKTRSLFVLEKTLQKG